MQHTVHCKLAFVIWEKQKTFEGWLVFWRLRMCFNFLPCMMRIQSYLWLGLELSRAGSGGQFLPSRGSCKQPRSSCVPPPTYHHQRPESHKQSPSYSGYKDAYLESLLKTVSTRGCIFTLDAFKMGWDKLLGIGFSTALKIVQRSLWPTADKKHFGSLIAFVKLPSPAPFSSCTL